MNPVLMIVLIAIIVLLACLLFIVSIRTGRLSKKLSDLDYFRSMIVQSVDGIVIADEKGVILEWNVAQQKITGIPSQEAVGSTIWEIQARLSPSEDGKKEPVNPLRDTVIEILKKGKLAGENQPLEYFIVRPDGERRFLQEMIFPIQTPRGYMLGSIVRDITGHGRIEEVLSEFALIDALTGLYNRRGFLLLADQQWRQSRIKNQRMMVFYADLDNMKRINDKLGHATGDVALKETADILRETFRETDLISRLGGDEFAAAAVGVNEESEKLILDRFDENLKKWNAEYKDFQLSVSFGYVMSDAGHDTFEMMLEAADAEMYQHKKNKKNK